MRLFLASLLLAACGADHQAAPVDAPSTGDATVADTAPALPTPIKYVVVIVKENHSFDNYFTGFPGAESSTKATLHDGTVITRAKAPDGPLAGDISHSHASAVTDYAKGKMNGFDLIVPSDPRRPFIRYTE